MRTTESSFQFLASEIINYQPLNITVTRRLYEKVLLKETNIKRRVACTELKTSGNMYFGLMSPTVGKAFQVTIL